MSPPSLSASARAHGPAVLGFLALTAALTWPLLVDGAPVSHRPDALVNLWNAWWVRVALFELGTSPYETSLLYHPDGISLALHTLSPANALAGALLSFVTGVAGAYRWVLLGHFFASALAFYAFAVALTGSRRAGFLAGLAFSFAPYHFATIARVNLASLEGLPLVALFLLRYRASGRASDLAGVALAGAWIGATAPSYLVHAALVGATLLVGVRSLPGEVPTGRAVRRLAVAALAALVGILATVWPMLRGVAGAGVSERWTGEEQLVLSSNDLLGYRWIVGPPEVAFVSWPTMLGCVALGLVAVRWRAALRQPAWLGLLVVGFVLSLGASLTVAGRDTGIPLVFDELAALPGVGALIRRPERFFVLVQFAFAVLVAAAAADLFGARAEAPRRSAWFAALVVATALEFTPAPLETFPLDEADVLRRLPEDAASVVDLPLRRERVLVHQMQHGRAAVGGYLTDFAVRTRYRRTTARWHEAWEALTEGRIELFEECVREFGVDLAVLDAVARTRGEPAFAGQTIWTPFVLARGLAQAWEAAPVELRKTRGHDRARATLVRRYGEPVLTGDGLSVFDLR